ncbi:MAG: hypothetical protein J1E79_06765, partial [Rikenella sp.]|nr:hypothetical protein [Rikenella sp.]
IPESLFGSFSSEKERFQPVHQRTKGIKPQKGAKPTRCELYTVFRFQGTNFQQVKLSCAPKRSGDGVE